MTMTKLGFKTCTNAKPTSFIFSKTTGASFVTASLFSFWKCTKHHCIKHNFSNIILNSEFNPHPERLDVNALIHIFLLIVFVPYKDLCSSEWQDLRKLYSQTTRISKDVHKTLNMLKDTGLSLDAESTLVKMPQKAFELWCSPSPVQTEHMQNTDFQSPNSKSWSKDV